MHGPGPELHLVRIGSSLSQVQDGCSAEPVVEHEDPGEDGIGPGVVEAEGDPVDIVDGGLVEGADVIDVVSCDTLRSSADKCIRSCWS